MKKDNLITLDFNIESKPTIEKINGVDTAVIPVVMLQEGKYNDVFYPSEVLARALWEWEGVPVTLNHPRADDGFPLSSKTIESEKGFNIGKIFYPEFKEKKLKASAYIDITKLKSLVEEKEYNDLINGTVTNVSTGLFVTTVNVGGANKGDLNIIATGIIPDHLAILPNTKGACSVEDGCGTMLNQKNNIIMTKKIETNKDDSKVCNCNSADLEAENNSLKEELKKLKEEIGELQNNAKELKVEDNKDDKVYISNEENALYQKLLKIRQNEMDDLKKALKEKTTELNDETLNSLSYDALVALNKISPAKAVQNKESAKREKISVLLAGDK